MANRYSEHLPEVVPDSSPQTLTYAETYERRGLDQGDEKYAVIYDDTPKIVTSVPTAGDGATPTSPAPAYRAAVAGADGASSMAGNMSPDVEDMGKRGKALAGSGERKILGMKRRTFFIILIAVVLVTAAAIGGGVGGFYAGKQKASGSDSTDVAEEAASSPTTTEPGTPRESSVDGSSDDETDDETDDEDSTTDESGNDDTDDNDSSDDESDADSSSTARSPTKPSPTSSKASPSPTPPKSGGGGGGGSDDDEDDDEEEEADSGGDDDDDSDNKPKPGFKFRGWKNANFKGSATDIIATTGFLDLPFDVTSYKWNPEGTDCCVTMCQGKKNDVGWRCTNFEREKSSASFGRIFIGCGAEASQASSRCS